MTPNDFGIGRRLTHDNWRQLRARGRAVNTRFLAALGEDQPEPMRPPSPRWSCHHRAPDGLRAPALRFGDPRVMDLLASIAACAPRRRWPHQRRPPPTTPGIPSPARRSGTRLRPRARQLLEHQRVAARETSPNCSEVSDKAPLVCTPDSLKQGDVQRAAPGHPPVVSVDRRPCRRGSPGPRRRDQSPGSPLP